MSLHVTAPFLWTAGTIFPVACIAVVAMRFVLRRVQHGKIGVDDWLTVPALVSVQHFDSLIALWHDCSLVLRQRFALYKGPSSDVRMVPDSAQILILGMAATILVGKCSESTCWTCPDIFSTGVAGQALGYPTPPFEGDPLAAATPKQILTREVYYAVNMMQILCLAFIKISCILFYRRIFFTGTTTTLNYFIYAFVGITVCWAVSFFFAFGFACGSHVYYAWTSVDNQLLCPGSYTMIDQSLAVTDLLLDLLLLIFPLPLIWRLHLRTSRKLLVSFIFFLGSLAIMASAAKLTIIYLELNEEWASTSDDDLTSTAGTYFTYIEPCFGLCAICLPSLSGVFKLKSVERLVDGFNSMLSSLSSGGRSRRNLSQQSTERVATNDSSRSSAGESVAPLTPAENAAGESNMWKVYSKDSDIELQNTKRKDGETA